MSLLYRLCSYRFDCWWTAPCPATDVLCFPSWTTEISASSPRPGFMYLMQSSSYRTSESFFSVHFWITIFYEVFLSIILFQPTTKFIELFQLLEQGRNFVDCSSREQIIVETHFGKMLLDLCGRLKPVFHPKFEGYRFMGVDAIYTKVVAL